MIFDINQKLTKNLYLQVAGIMIKKAAVGGTIIVGWSLVAGGRLFGENMFTQLLLGLHSPCLADYLQFTKQHLLSKLSQVESVLSSTLD